MADRNTGIGRDQLRDYTLKRQDISPDGLVWQEPVIDKDLTTPPGSPSEDDRYLIISGASGTDWAGHDNEITHYHNEQWNYYTPIEGWFIWILDENKFYEYKDSNWSKFEAGDIDVKILDSPTYDDIQDWINTTQSSGIISGGAITDNEDGTITVAGGTGFIKISDSETAETIFFDWETNDNVSLTDNARNRIYIDYNSGSPIILASVSEPNHNTQVTLGCVYREGTSLTITEGGQSIYNLAWRVHHHLREAHGVERVSGAIIGETGTRNLTVSSSVIYTGLNRDTISAFDSSASGEIFSYYYRDGGTGWTKVSDQTQIDNTYYDDGDGTLAELIVNRYGVHWVYMDFGGNIFVIYGQGSYTLANAQNTTVPVSLPDRIVTCGLLLGRIIIQKGAASFTEIASAFITVFALTLVTSHNDLADLQGGTGGEYYHLTSAEYTELNQWLDNVTLGSDGKLTLPSGVAIDEFSSDGTLGGDSDLAVPTEKAVKAYADTLGKISKGDSKVEVVDAGAGYIQFQVDNAEQLRLIDGKWYPITDDDVSLGDSTHRFKELHLMPSSLYLGDTKITEDSYNRNELNIMLLAFWRAVDNSKTIYGMVDGVVDEFEDESGVDTGASANEDYDEANDLYKPTTVADIELDYMEYATDGAAQAAYVTSAPGLPTSEYSSDSYTKLLLHCNGADESTTIPDSGNTNHGNASIVANAQLDTAQKKFGTAGLLLDGTDDYIYYADHVDWYFGTGNWTIDFWVRFNEDPSANAQGLLEWNVDGSHTWQIYSDATGKLHSYFYDADGSPLYIYPETTNAVFASANTWYHVAIVRYGTGLNNMKMFIDGVSKALTWNSNLPENAEFSNFAAELHIGKSQTPNLNGWIDEFRISKGIARWTADFDVLSLQCYSESSLKQQGSYSLKVSATDEALNETLTKSGLSIDLSDMDDLKIYCRASRTGSNFKVKIHDSGGTTSEKTIVISQVDTWEQTTWDISGIGNSDKDDIDQIIVEIINADSANTIYLDEFYAPGEVNNMTLISLATEAEAEPDNARLVLFEEDVDAITINTDLEAYSSRDNGANWVQATLTDEGDYASGKRILTAIADISGQASDKTMKWKVETLNNKDLKLHCMGMLWS